MTEPKTGEDKVKWDRFLRKLDRRYWHISPPGIVVRCSAVSAKHMAMEVLHTLDVGEKVWVTGEDAVWSQEKRASIRQWLFHNHEQVDQERS